jgi:hypothetical protein
MWVPDYDGDGTIEPHEEMRYNDEALGGRYFSDWTPFDHPEIGAVEIGGWHRKFWGQNPPAEHLEEETSAQLPWILYLAEQAPVLALDDVRTEPLGDGRFAVEATVRNDGFLPTSLTDRGAVGTDPADGAVEHQIVRPVHVSLELASGVTLVEGAPRASAGHLAGTGPFIGDVGPRERTVRWVVAVEAGAAAPSVRVVAASDKAGTVRSERVPVR